MEMLLLLLLAFAPTSQPSATALADFSRLSKAAGQGIALVDLDGTVREGLLILATDEALTMRFAGGDRIFSRSTVTSAERLRDGNRDGAIKGALFGALIGAIAAQFDAGSSGEVFFKSVAVYGGIGWMLDASQKHRQPIYRAAAPEPSLKVSLRF